jgi:uncharacterized protein
MRSSTSRGFALVTGAGQGIGRAFARDLAQRGWDLVLVSLPGSGLDALARELTRRHGCRVYALERDLTAAAARAELVSLLDERDLPLTMLVNNAGAGRKGAFAAASYEAWREIIELNVIAATGLTHALMPRLERQGRAHIINVASLAAFYPMPYFGVYASTKAFLLHWSLALRGEVAGRGVSVTVLAPGAVRTNPRMGADIDAQGLLGRLAERLPDEVAGLAIDGALKGRALVVPGLLNRVFLLGALFPKELAASLLGRRWSRLHQRPAPAGPPPALLASALGRAPAG